MKEEIRPKAFISCSLREEDKDFVDFITRIVMRFGFEPMGTIGKYQAAPIPIWQQMKEGIASADCVVLIATPRYLQQDINDKNKTGQGISEMLHIEVGMAVMSGKPILAFVLEGTDIGGFLPQAIQYIELKHTDFEGLASKWPLIANYFRSAMSIIQKKWYENENKKMLKIAGTILAIIGGASVLDRIFPDN